MVRKGMMVGRGSGYKNVVGRDPAVHSQSSKGIKQPQNITIITPKFETSLDADRPIIKTDLDEFKKINKDEITTSDLQGVAMAYGIKYIGSNNPVAVSEVEDIFLQYANGDMDINTAKRYVEEIILQNKDLQDNINLKKGIVDPHIELNEETRNLIKQRQEAEESFSKEFIKEREPKKNKPATIIQAWREIPMKSFSSNPKEPRTRTFIRGDKKVSIVTFPENNYINVLKRTNNKLWDKKEFPNTFEGNKEALKYALGKNPQII